MKPRGTTSGAGGVGGIRVSRHALTVGSNAAGNNTAASIQRWDTERLLLNMLLIRRRTDGSVKTGRGIQGFRPPINSNGR
jgi:hypothetical protein